MENSPIFGYQIHVQRSSKHRSPPDSSLPSQLRAPQPRLVICRDVFMGRLEAQHILYNSKISESDESSLRSNPTPRQAH